MTSAQTQLSRKYLAYKTLTNLWFMGAVWLYLYRIFITDYQVGILDALAFAAGLVAEVPSGALADRFGRDKLVKLGQLLAGSGLLIQAFGSSFIPFCLGQAITMVGVAFVSGADDALFFEKLNFERGTAYWKKLVTRGTQFDLSATLCATVIGGWLHTFNPRLPWVLTGIAFLLSVLVIWSVKDTRVQKASKGLATELKAYLTSIKTGFKQFKTAELFPYVPLIIIVQGLFYAAGWGLLRLVLLDRFHFDPFWGAVAVATSSLITVGILSVIHRHAARLTEKHVLVVVSLSAAAALLLALANIGWWGYIVILALYAGEHILHPFMSEILNQHAHEEHRATILSVASFLRTLPYVLLAPLIGWLNTHQQLEYFLISWPVLILLALWLYLALQKQYMKVAIPENVSLQEPRTPEASL